MEKEIRKVCYDTKLNIEAYHFKGIMQKFPNHFHPYYVIGFIEYGKRYLLAKNKEYIIETGDIVLFNPKDTHTCQQVDHRPLDYRCINIAYDVMKKAVFEITGQSKTPYFTRQVLLRSELTDSLSELHTMILEGKKEFKKEELFYFLIEQLLEECTPLPHTKEKEPSIEIKMVCDYLENNYANTITLDDLSALTGFSKYYLLRSFTKQKGISPYNYLETIRIEKAKKLLEKGTSPVETALFTGFTDQSHFSHFFKRFIGLTPKQYMKIFEK